MGINHRNVRQVLNCGPDAPGPLFIFAWFVCFVHPPSRIAGLRRTGGQNFCARAINPSGALQNKKNRTTCAARVNKNWSAQSSGNHAHDPGHELAAEKVHPSALPVEEGHALITVALDLHRDARGRQATVVFLRRVRYFLLHKMNIHRNEGKRSLYFNIYFPKDVWILEEIAAFIG
jgi:hypothetical protein